MRITRCRACDKGLAIIQPRSTPGVSCEAAIVFEAVTDFPESTENVSQEEKWILKKIEWFIRQVVCLR